MCAQAATATATVTPLGNFLQGLLLSNSDRTADSTVRLQEDEESSILTIVSDNCGKLPEKARQLVRLSYQETTGGGRSSSFPSGCRWGDKESCNPPSPQFLQNRKGIHKKQNRPAEQIVDPRKAARRKTGRRRRTGRRTITRCSTPSKPFENTTPAVNNAPSSSSSAEPCKRPCRRASMESLEAQLWVNNHTKENGQLHYSNDGTEQSCLKWLMALDSKESSSSKKNDSLFSFDFDVELLSDSDSDSDDDDDSSESSSSSSSLEDDSDSEEEEEDDDDSDDDDDSSTDSDSSSCCSSSSYDELFQDLFNMQQHGFSSSSSSSAVPRATPTPNSNNRNHQPKPTSQQKKKVVTKNPHDWTLPSNTVLPCNLQSIFQQAAHNPNMDIEKTIQASIRKMTTNPAASAAADHQPQYHYGPIITANTA